MKVLIYDRDIAISDSEKEKYDRVIFADGRYAPCQGCFKCWTKTPATCVMKDSLHEMCRLIGLTDDLVIVTENWYGGYSPAVKNLLDRSIGMSTPMSTYRGKQMHHVLRYGGHSSVRIYVTGDVSDKEKETWKLMTQRNALNWGVSDYEVSFTDPLDDVEVAEL
ncbi:MAG: NAD(P)H-dependent oxidoreductase [Lachnospiraceae bacterium]|nr:NAD(P)H-dependent oxidoreductase [Lachnospiraceae bacterium]